MGGCSSVHPDVDLARLTLMESNSKKLGGGEPDWLCNHQSQSGSNPDILTEHRSGKLE